MSVGELPLLHVPWHTPADVLQFNKQFVSVCACGSTDWIPVDGAGTVTVCCAKRTRSSSKACVCVHVRPRQKRQDANLDIIKSSQSPVIPVAGVGLGGNATGTGLPMRKAAQDSTSRGRPRSVKTDSG